MKSTRSSYIDTSRFKEIISTDTTKEHIYRTLNNDDMRMLFALCFYLQWQRIVTGGDRSWWEKIFIDNNHNTFFEKLILVWLEMKWNKRMKGGNLILSWVHSSRIKTTDVNSYESDW